MNSKIINHKSKIYVGADHRGFELKESLKTWLENDWTVLDMGAYQLDKDDDYTLYAEKVGSMVVDNPKSFGILLCGSGVGVDVAVNKIDGVRASIGKEVGQVKAGRADDNMNVLVIATDFTIPAQAKEMVKVFLSTKFAGKARHKRRLEEIRRMEENN